MKAWITRERKGNDQSYFVFIWSKKPIWSGVGWIALEDCSIMDTRAKGAKDFLGYTPRKGSCREVELDIKEIKK